MTPINGNIVEKNIFEERMNAIMDYTANAVAKTLGPYGHKALIQTIDGITSTKDGWHVLQKVQFDNIIDNSIKSMIEAVAQSVVLKVGDGTTTSMYLTNEFLKRLNVDDMSIRDIETSLTGVIDLVIEYLRKNANDINKNNLYDRIHNIAMVSSNWDTELSDLIANIYKETNNPIIKIQNSGTDKTFAEIIEGYELAGSLASPFYVNNFSDQTCEVEHPIILMLNFRITDKYYIPLSLLSGCFEPNTPFIVMAPGFDNAFISALNNTNYKLQTSGSGIKKLNLIPVQFENKFLIDRKCSEDFAILTNASLVSKNDKDNDIDDFFDDITKTLGNKTATPNDSMNEEELKKIQDEIEAKQNFRIMATQYVIDIGGQCEKAVINDKGIIVQGLYNGNEELIKSRMSEIESEIDTKTRECDALTIITDDIRQKRIRLGKLQGKMGVIKVGGFGDGDLKAKKDAVDDTTRACEAAYRYGYTVGGSIAPLIAINDIIEAINIGEIKLDDVNVKILYELEEAYKEVFRKLCSNKNNTLSDNASDIINECKNSRCGYDIITESYDTDMTKVLNPVNVDIEILRSCLRLILIAVTSDQFLFHQYHDYNPFTGKEPEVVELDSNIKTTVINEHK